MKQFLNSIYMALITENQTLINILLVPAGIIEGYLSINLSTIMLNIKLSRKQKLLYAFLMLPISLLSENYIPTPFNIVFNYVFMVLIIKLVTKLTLLKSFIALVLSSFIFGLSNTLLQNPYIKILGITPEMFINVPIYRALYLFILYSIIFALSIFAKKFRNIKFSLDFIDALDKKTLKILCINISLGFLVLILQLVLTAFYIDIVPLLITLLSFLLLILFFTLSIYSFTRIVKLANTRRDLQNAEEYNKSLEILYDKVKGFKHDFDNIISSLDGYIENNDISGLKTYFKEVKKDCKITNNLSILNPRIINNPGIYSLLNNKYFKATNVGIRFDIDFFLDLNNLPINIYKFSRILGILLDNAIEEAEKCKDKIVRISFRRENKNRRAIILIENTYSNKDVNVDDIFKKGVSGKENHSGIGLWEVRNYIKRSKNLDLYTSKNNEFFKQELAIYDIKNGKTTI